MHPILPWMFVLVFAIAALGTLLLSAITAVPESMAAILILVALFFLSIGESKNESHHEPYN